MTSATDKLVYQASVTYRLHLDNLRWTLLGGYAIFLAAIVGLSQLTTNTIAISQPSISLLAFILSFVYLWILAIQNWFYNLFARWADDCETQLIGGNPLLSLQTFAKYAGPTISPFHPAFFFAEILVGSVAYFFLTLTIKNSTIPGLTEILLSVPTWLTIFLWGGVFVLYFTFLNVVFLRWDKMVYKPIIRRFSNLYQQGNNKV
jgi:hypothetical protein